MVLLLLNLCPFFQSYSMTRTSCNCFHLISFLFSSLHVSLKKRMHCEEWEILSIFLHIFVSLVSLVNQCSMERWTQVRHETKKIEKGGTTEGDAKLMRASPFFLVDSCISQLHVIHLLFLLPIYFQCSLVSQPSKKTRGILHHVSWGRVRFLRISNITSVCLVGRETDEAGKKTTKKRAGMKWRSGMKQLICQSSVEPRTLGVHLRSHPLIVNLPHSNSVLHSFTH